MEIKWMLKDVVRSDKSVVVIMVGVYKGKNVRLESTSYKTRQISGYVAHSEPIYKYYLEGYSRGWNTQSELVKTIETL